MSTKVYGASDDLIEFEGDLRGEVGCYDTAVLVVLSDGTVLEIRYDERGIFTILPKRKGQLFERIESCSDPDADPHSDVVHLSGGIKWAYAAKEWEPVK